MPDLIFVINKSGRFVDIKNLALFYFSGFLYKFL